MSSSSAVWQPERVVRKLQPLGDGGAQFSLEEVAVKATEGRLDPLVRSWTVRVIGAAGNPKSEVAKASAILDAQRAKVIWVPDPVHAEHIQSARITLALSQGGDCDDVVVLCAAAMMSIGLRCQVVGHAYDSDHSIQHVLLRVYCDNQWYYAEPSLKNVAFGKLARKPSWERFLDLPVVTGKKPKVVCDDSECMVSLGMRPPPTLTHQGDYVGVGHPPGVGSLLDVSGTEFGQHFNEAGLDYTLSASSMQSTHDELWATAAKLPLNQFPEQGPGGNIGWTTDEEARYTFLVEIYNTVEQIIQQGVDGVRALVFDNVASAAGIASLATDAIRIDLSASGVPEVVNTKTGEVLSLDPNAPTPPPQHAAVHGVGVGTYGAIIAAVVVVSLAGIYALVNYNNQITERLRLALEFLRQQTQADFVRTGKATYEQYTAHERVIVDVKKAEVDAIKAANTPFQIPDVPKGWSDTAKGVAWIIGLSVAGYAVVKLLPARSPSPERAARPHAPERLLSR